jgi:hypothetical protein
MESPERCMIRMANGGIVVQANVFKHVAVYILFHFIIFILCVRLSRRRLVCNNELPRK